MYIPFIELIDQVEAKSLSEAPQAWVDALTQRLSQGVKPRTHHFDAQGKPKYINRLVLETSPYLRQHAHNPVEWYPWSKEAFQRAQKEDKPILLSIGYSTCHWCHVMERESFEDEEIARYLNQHFIAIKVDREERPDLDELYMKAVQLMTGRGGWPMTTVLTHDGTPFFGGTYFPPRDGTRGRRRGFLTILKELKQRYHNDRQTLLREAKQLSQRMAEKAAPKRGSQSVSPELVVEAVQRLATRFDSRNGGFGRAPKFPTPVHLKLLLDYAAKVGDPTALRMVEITLTKMAYGGVYDQVGGGFHRYATDQRWRVPHFEKMLYDNAQLALVYMEAATLSKDQSRVEEFSLVAREILDYLLREMLSADHLFYSATDADSLGPGVDHPEEGLFFTWTPEEINLALEPELAQLAMRVYQITPRGDLDGRNILRKKHGVRTLAGRVGLSLDTFKDRLSQIRKKLYKVRSRRPHPLRDDKAITSWNGLAVSAFARGAILLHEPRYLIAAQKTARALLQRLKSSDGRLARTYMDGVAKHRGVLDDYAFLIQGLLNLFEVDSQPLWLKEAIALQAYLDRHFWSTRYQAYTMTSDRAEGLITQLVPLYDGAEPSGNSIAAQNLVRLNLLTQQPLLGKRLTALLKTSASRLPYGGLSAMVSALLTQVDEARQLVIVVPQGQVVEQHPLLTVGHDKRWGRLSLVIAPDSLTSPTRRILNQLIPWLGDKRMVGDQITAYLCFEGYCDRPTHDVEELRNSLERRSTLLPDRSPAPLPF